MKSEERHHLAENDLEQTLNRWLEKLEPYSNHILGGILLATALMVGGILWKRTAQATADEGWTLFIAAQSADDFLQVAETYPDSNAADWARLRAARMLYDRAVEVSLTDRAASDADFVQAKELFGGLLKSSVPKEIRESALDGMARSLEATSAGDMSEAIKAYETLIAEFPNSVYKDYAQHRIDVLKKPEASEFYAWFRKQNPKPADRPKPNDSGATGLTVPGLPELPLGTAAEEATELDSATSSLPAGEQSAPAETPPATSDGGAKSETETKPASEGEAAAETPSAEAAEAVDPAPETSTDAAPEAEPAPESSSEAAGSEETPPSAQ